QEFIEDKDIEVPLLSDPTLKVINAWGVAQEGEDIAVPFTGST
ncbi:MAG: peroxiredoxin family protein, partial [Proteobacteria bacterium]|nr:peroxiredoxin family protein [Pseudomonadota bacterium]